MKTSSTLVIVIPLLVAGVVIAGVLYYNTKAPLEDPVIVSAKTAVPALNGAAGKPQNGFAVSELTQNAVADLSQELDSISDDTASDDFEALQSDASSL